MKPLLLSILLIICSPAFADNTIEENKQKTIQTRAILIGKWCGNQQLLNGDHQIWTVNRYASGTYKINVTLTKKDGEKSTWGEYGIWGVRYPIYFTAARGFIENKKRFPADTTSADLYDAFTIKSVTAQDFTYQSLTSGNTYTVSKKCR